MMRWHDVIPVILCAALFLWPIPARAADRVDGHRAGGSIESLLIGGFGTGKIPEGTYRTIPVIWHVGWELQRYFARLKSHRGIVSGFLEPQFVIATAPESNLEAGLGLGIQYRYPLSDRFWGYLLASTGPHVITLVTTTQENGFIFSNALGAGLYYFLDGRSAVTLGYRWRHMSNAGLNRPNHGINSQFITLGYALFF